tara:strand:+ start:3291 stop:4460 length:1170 start_codon:yes stop_codon:yes gene_type:complete
MKKILLMLIFLLSNSLFTLEKVIGNYIFNDIDSSTTFKIRTTFLDSKDDPWQVMSNVAIHSSFPKLRLYLNIDPHIEFEYFSNHIGNSDSYTRLVESYVNFHNKYGMFSIGNQRLKFQEGQFISDSTFSLLKRSFSQFSFQNLTQNFKLYSIFSVTNSGETQPTNFKKASYFLVWNKLFQRHLETVSSRSFFSMDAAAFLIEDHSNTFFISPQFKVSDSFDIVSSFAFQQTPSITTQPTLDKHASYYDLTLNFRKFLTTLSFGTRFFSGNNNTKNQFTAPYSSGYSWDGYLNIFQSNIINGFNDHFRSVYSQFSTTLANGKTVSIHSFLFRNNDFSKNLGGEIDISISDSILSDNVIWTYKLGQYFSGSQIDTEATLGMWLDFTIKMDD